MRLALCKSFRPLQKSLWSFLVVCSMIEKAELKNRGDKVIKDQSM